MAEVSGLREGDVLIRNAPFVPGRAAPYNSGGVPDMRAYGGAYMTDCHDGAEIQILDMQAPSDSGTRRIRVRYLKGDNLRSVRPGEEALLEIGTAEELGLAPGDEVCELPPYVSGRGQQNPNFNAGAYVRKVKILDTDVPMGEGPTTGRGIMVRYLTPDPLSNIHAGEVIIMAPEYPDFFFEYQASLPTLARAVRHAGSASHRTWVPHSRTAGQKPTASQRGHWTDRLAASLSSLASYMF